MDLLGDFGQKRRDEGAADYGRFGQNEEGYASSVLLAWLPASVTLTCKKEMPMQKITPYLWYNKEAKEAAEFYTALFPNSKITHLSQIHDTPSGDCDIVSFELNGQPFMAISAGPLFKFNEAISFIVPCENQEEIDYYWEKLSADPKAEQCGWCKDKFGVSWQVWPVALGEMMKLGTPEQVSRVTQAFLSMKKFDIAALERAFNMDKS